MHNNSNSDKFTSYNSISIILTIAFIIVIVYFSIITQVIYTKDKDKKCSPLDFIINDTNETIKNCINFEDKSKDALLSVKEEYSNSLKNIDYFVKDITNSFNDIKSINQDKYNTLIDDLSNNINYMKITNENTNNDTINTNRNLNNTLNDINQYLN